MARDVRKLFDDALALPVARRAELAAELLASLDGDPDDDVEAAWLAEVERRARAAIARPDDEIAWDAVRAELHAT